MLLLTEYPGKLYATQMPHFQCFVKNCAIYLLFKKGGQSCRIMNDKGNASDYKKSYLLFTLAFEIILPLEETCLTFRHRASPV